MYGVDSPNMQESFLREEHRSLAPCHSAGATILAVSYNVK
jgi:hypothetical protein